MNILLTGASRGIGAAAFDALRSAGHHVIGHSSRGGDGLIAADLANSRAPGALWASALEAAGGRIDVLINNAGIFESAVVDGSDSEWQAAWARTMTINLQAAADLCRLAVRHFRERGAKEDGGGRIVNVASRAAWRGDSPDHWHYAASKGAMISMTKTIARAYGAENILAYAVCPGFTLTPMADDYLDSGGAAQVLADIPLGRVATTEEIGEIIRWLATDAPASATGTAIDANGASYVR